MRKQTLAGVVFSAALLGAGITDAFAADETLRSYAEKNGIYIGAILNSQWFGGGLPAQYEQIHKAQFNIVVAENEMKFDATEPSENRFNYNNGDKMVRWSGTQSRTACASVATLWLGIARSRTG